MERTAVGATKMPPLAQLVACPDLAVRREGRGEPDDRLLRVFFQPVLQVGYSPADFKQVPTQPTFLAV